MRKYLHSVMKNHKLSYQKLANALGMSKSGIAHIVKGTRNPSWQTAHKIASFFGVPIEVIFEVEFSIPKKGGKEQ